MYYNNRESNTHEFVKFIETRMEKGKGIVRAAFAYGSKERNNSNRGGSDNGKGFRVPLATLLRCIRAILLAINPSRGVALVRKKHRVTFRHNLELAMAGRFGRFSFACSLLFLTMEKLISCKVRKNRVNRVNRALRTSCKTFVRLPSSLAFASFIRSRTPTSCPSTYSSPVFRASPSAFWICFFTSPVASGRSVLYSVSCFESRIENLSVSTLTFTFLTL